MMTPDAEGVFIPEGGMVDADASVAAFLAARVGTGRRSGNASASWPSMRVPAAFA